MAGIIRAFSIRHSAFGVLCCSFLLLALPARAAVFHPETFTLANGLQVVVVPNRLSPAVEQMVWYKVGSADEAAGHSGLAHYLEHLMFRGTEALPGGAFSRVIAETGGEDNAFTSYDFTAYHETVAADRLGTVMQMEADRMQNLQITPETAATELKVVLAEREERTGNSPQGLFHEKIRKALFARHPYGVPVIGHQDEIAKATPEDAREFYEHHYAPNNAVVVISGNVELSEVMRLAAGTFGRLPKHNVPPRPFLSKPAVPAAKRVDMRDARVQQPHLEVHVAGPSYATQTKGEAYALEVLGEALCGGEVGVLYRQLVIQQKIASGVDVSYDPQARGPAEFMLVVTPQPGRSMDELEKALDAALRGLATRGIDRKTVAAAKGRLTRAAIFARDSLSFSGQVLGQALTTGESVDEVEAWPERIDAVTVDRVNASLRDFVKNPHRVTGVLMPESAAQ
jgi:zinc protease